MSDFKHLWDVEHSYYCEEGNFFQSGYHTVYDSWESFAQPVTSFFEGNPLYEFDNDLNFLFRWDWQKADPENYLFSYSQEILDETGITEEEIENSKEEFKQNSQVDKLLLFYMIQRKGYNISVEVKVVEDDEPVVREWLEKKWIHMKNMWMPVSQ